MFIYIFFYFSHNLSMRKHERKYALINQKIPSEEGKKTLSKQTSHTRVS